MINIVARTPTDDELKEFIMLQEQVKYLTKRLEELKALCKARGSFSTDRYVCAVMEQQRTGLAGLKEVEKVLGLELLQRFNLIRTSPYLLVKVTPVAKEIKTISINDLDLDSVVNED